MSETTMQDSGDTGATGDNDTGGGTLVDGWLIRLNCNDDSRIWMALSLDQARGHLMGPEVQNYMTSLGERGEEGRQALEKWTGEHGFAIFPWTLQGALAKNPMLHEGREGVWVSKQGYIM
jgi:hypothetical protein